MDQLQRQMMVEALRAGQNQGGAYGAANDVMSGMMQGYSMRPELQNQTLNPQMQAAMGVTNKPAVRAPMQNVTNMPDMTKGQMMVNALRG